MKDADLKRHAIAVMLFSAGLMSFACSFVESTTLRSLTLIVLSSPWWVWE